MSLQLNYVLLEIIDSIDALIKLKDFNSFEYLNLKRLKL